jgi:hypothetical protein
MDSTLTLAPEFDSVPLPEEPSPLQIAEQVLAGAEKREHDARLAYHEAETAYCDAGRKPDLVDWVREKRLDHARAARLLHDGREGLRKAERDHAERNRR